MPIIKHRTYIKAEPERVFETLTTAQGWNAWFTDRTTIDLKTNGTSEILFRWSNFGLNHEEIQDGGEIIEIIPNKSFIFHWSPGEGKTIVKFELQPLREGTLLVVEEKDILLLLKTLKHVLDVLSAGEKH